MKWFLLLLLPLIFVSCATTNLTVEEQEYLNIAYELKKIYKVSATSFEFLSNEEFDEMFPGGYFTVTHYQNGWNTIYFKEIKYPDIFKLMVCHELAHAKTNNKYAPKFINHGIEWYYCFLEFSYKTGICYDKYFSNYRKHLIDDYKL